MLTACGLDVLPISVHWRASINSRTAYHGKPPPYPSLPPGLTPYPPYHPLVWKKNKLSVWWAGKAFAARFWRSSEYHGCASQAFAQLARYGKPPPSYPPHPGLTEVSGQNKWTHTNRAWGGSREPLEPSGRSSGESLECPNAVCRKKLTLNRFQQGSTVRRRVIFCSFLSVPKPILSGIESKY